MTDFLVISGIDLNVIEKLKEEPSIIYDLYCNKEECIKIIRLLKLFGIKNINDLMLYKTRLFLKTKDEVVDFFNQNNIIELVNLDINNVDAIF